MPHLDDPTAPRPTDGGGLLAIEPDDETGSMDEDEVRREIERLKALLD